MNKKIWLVVIIVFIALAIWYLESMKAAPGGSGGGQSIAVSGGGVPASSTVGASSSSSVSAALQALAAADAKAGYMPAKEIVDPTGFVNASSTFTLGSLIGKKVILLDFWTYSCINCIRTIPHLNAWQQQYSNDGLEIVGIHTPEFDFEKNISNVKSAVAQYGIQYPVVLDSDYGTWNAYDNLYWPAEYLIDMAGYVVHTSIGEGDYDTTEAAIQTLLDQRAQILGLPAPTVATTTVVIPQGPSGGPMSPETYFGAARNEYLANGTPQAGGVQTLTAPSSLSTSALYLSGTWDFEDQYATNQSAGAKVIYQYQAQNVYFVASAAASTTIDVMQDGAPLPASISGSDVHDGKLVVGPSRLYNIVANPTSGTHTLEFIIEKPGLEAFTFTFG